MRITMINVKERDKNLAFLNIYFLHVVALWSPCLEIQGHVFASCAKPPPSFLTSHFLAADLYHD